MALSTAELIDKKAIGRPNTFAGTDSDISDWNFQLVSYLECLMPMPPFLMQLAENQQAVIDHAALTAKWKTALD